ncbi:MAG TPA: alpha/beta fold hydrolase [Myxococcota bacterium]|nr:alpha/beta fold hydrolase [Myxococcota bacterium]
MRAPARIALLLGCVIASPATAQEPAAAGTTPETVVLVHGLYRSERSMAPLASRLEAAGYAVQNLRYASTRGTPDELEAVLEEQVRQCCADAARVDFVTHSLGGILVRAMLARHAPANLGRVVMLAPPNHGSELVDWLGPLGFALGPTGRELGTAPTSLPNRLPPPSYSLGVIAGTFSWNPIGSLVLPGASDGTVSVASTRLDGMTDFVALPTSHTFILRSDAAADRVLEFLRAGRFGEEASP